MPLGLGPLGGGGGIYESALARLRRAGAPVSMLGPPEQASAPGGIPGGAGGVAGAGGPALGFQGTQPHALGAFTPRWASWQAAAPQAPIGDIVKKATAGHALTQNPQLVQAHPLGAATDSQYEAENAVLEQQINAAYQDILQQTGYDVGGKHIPGDVELGAARAERNLLTGMGNATDEVTGRMQQAGTIFSGYHAGERARAQQPGITGLGDLAVDTPRTLARLNEQAQDVMRQYTVEQNMLLMQAAQRRAALLAMQEAAARGAYPTGEEPMLPPDNYMAPMSERVGALQTGGGQEATIGQYWQEAYPDYFGTAASTTGGAAGAPASAGFGGLTDRGSGSDYWRRRRLGLA